MPIAVIELTFDPILRVAGAAIRLDALVLAGGILLSLLLAASIARRTPAPDRDTTEPRDRQPTLRTDDLLYLALAALPGAIIGGRIGHALLHVAYYRADPAALLDPGRGSLELSLGVVGGALSAGLVAWALREPVRRWLHVAAVPTLLAIGTGKVAMALGGRGQGMPSSIDWATAYLGPGPWGGLAPEVPAHPAQLYEAATAGGIAVVLGVLLASGGFGRRDGLAFFLGIGAWALARAAIASTWLDQSGIGSLRAAQALALVVAVGCVVGAVAARRAPVRAAVVPDPAPQWPDPETRPRF